jgi:hypothetical protein
VSGSRTVTARRSASETSSEIDLVTVTDSVFVSGSWSAFEMPTASERGSGFGCAFASGLWSAFDL